DPGSLQAPAPAAARRDSARGRDEVAQHLLRDVEVGDHAVLQGTNGQDAVRPASLCQRWITRVSASEFHRLLNRRVQSLGGLARVLLTGTRGCWPNKCSDSSRRTSLSTWGPPTRWSSCGTRASSSMSPRSSPFAERTAP